jgi:hypothetical protein
LEKLHDNGVKGSLSCTLDSGMETVSGRQDASDPEIGHLPDVMKVTEKARQLHFNAP